MAASKQVRALNSGSVAPRGPAWLLLIAALAIVSIGVALVAQYRFDMQPCPYCILQRLIYLVIAVVCVIGALLPSRGVRNGAAALALPLAAGGAAAAVYQHVVAAKLYSCNLTLADQILSALKVESLWPSVMGVTATCADAAASVLGVPFEYWSLAAFALIGLLAMAALLKR
jgi:disulfide bond formation protein DsbB